MYRSQLDSPAVRPPDSPPHTDLSEGDFDLSGAEMQSRTRTRAPAAAGMQLSAAASAAVAAAPSTTTAASMPATSASVRPGSQAAGASVATGELSELSEDISLERFEDDDLGMSQEDSELTL